jgi:hypothetical protein
VIDYLQWSKGAWPLEDVKKGWIVEQCPHSSAFTDDDSDVGGITYG